MQFRQPYIPWMPRSEGRPTFWITNRIGSRWLFGHQGWCVGPNQEAFAARWRLDRYLYLNMDEHRARKICRLERVLSAGRQQAKSESSQPGSRQD